MKSDMGVSCLSIVASELDLAGIQHACPEALEHTVVAFDPDVHVRLLAEGIAHRTVWDFVTAQECEEVQAYQEQVWQAWCELAHAQVDGLDVLHMMWYRHRSCWGRLVWAAYGVSRIISALQPAEVVVFDDADGHGLDQPESQRHPPLFSGIVRYIAGQNHIRVRLLARPRCAGEPNFVDRTAHQGYCELNSIDAAAALAGRPYVLFPGSGVDLLSQLPVIRRLLADTPLAVVQLYKSASAQILQQARALGHFVWHESQVGTVRHSAVDEAFVSRVRGEFEDGAKKLPDQLRALLANPHIQSHYDFVFGDYVHKMIRHLANWSAFLLQFRPAAVVAHYPTAIFEVAAHIGVPCLALSHAPMLVGHAEWFRSFPPCFIGALNKRQRTNLQQAGLCEQRIRVVGDPRLDQVGQASTGSNSNRYASLTDGRQRVILLLTGNLGSPSIMDGVPRCNWAQAVGDIRHLSALAGRHPDWRFIVKCHPRYDHPQIYDYFNRALPQKRRFTITTDSVLSECVQRADVAIVCNALTSALVEASPYGKPVVVFDPAVVWYDRQRWATADWPQADSVTNLEQELTSMFGNAVHYERRTRETRRAFDSFADYAGSSSQKIVDTIIQIAESAVNVPAGD